MVWIDHIDQRSIVAEVHCIGQREDLSFDARRLPFEAHLHVDPLGRQHLILKGTTSHVRLLISGPLVSVAPVAIRFVLDGLERLDTQLHALTALSGLLRGTSGRSSIDKLGEIERLRLRDAIIALDGEQAGATRREIATVIYGADRVAEEWGEPSGRLKAVIKRDVLRGRRLVAGGYRQLVAGGTNAVTA